MSVAYEIIKALMEFVGGFVGLEGALIGTLAVGVVGTYYLHEASGLFVLLARYSRMVSIILAAVLLILVGGSVTGVVELSPNGIVSQLFDRVTEVFH